MRGGQVFRTIGVVDTVGLTWAEVVGVRRRQDPQTSMPPLMDLVRGWRWTTRCARSGGKAVEALTSLSPVLDPPYAEEEQAGLGRAAYRDFGKGSEHQVEIVIRRGRHGLYSIA